MTNGVYIQYFIVSFLWFVDLEWIKAANFNHWKTTENDDVVKLESMDIDDQKEDEQDDEKKNWSERILFVQNSNEMKQILQELIDSDNNSKYDHAINFIINKCYDLMGKSQNKEALTESVDMLKNGMLTMISKYNRDQIAFVSLIYEIMTTQNLEQMMEGLSMKLSAMDTVPSFNGLYALFYACYGLQNEENKKLICKLINTICNHLQTDIFAKQREFENKIKNMRQQNVIYHHQYANKVYTNYLNQDCSINVFLHQNNIMERLHLFSWNGKNQEVTVQNVQLLFRYISDLIKNIKFSSKKKNKLFAMNQDYLHQPDINLFCSDSSTRFLCNLFSNQLRSDFVNVISPTIIGLIHCMYPHSKKKAIAKRRKFLFLSFKQNQYYEYMLALGIQTTHVFFDDDLEQLIRKNMNKLLTFLYFVYFAIWSQCDDEEEQYKNMNILHRCSDILLAKKCESAALQMLMENCNSLKKVVEHEKFHSLSSVNQYIAKEHGLMFLDDKLLSHFIYLCCLNGKKIEAVLLWQLSSDSCRIKYALHIIKNELSVKCMEEHIDANPDCNLFECIFESLIFCALKDKFGTKSSKIDKKLNEYLDSFEMGADPKLKAIQLCDFIFNPKL